MRFVKTALEGESNMRKANIDTLFDNILTTNWKHRLVFSKILAESWVTSGRFSPQYFEKADSELGGEPGSEVRSWYQPSTVPLARDTVATDAGSELHFSKMHFSKILQIFNGLVLDCIKTKCNEQIRV